jgi:uncharacterized protein
MRSSFLAIPGLALALAGPAVVAFAANYAAGATHAVSVHVLSLASIMAIVLVVFASAIRVEGIALRQLGFDRASWSSIPIGLALALFFVTVFGPLAYWMVAKLQMGGFDDGLSRLAKLPTWYLVLAIVIVATSEELLWRAYAIESLAAITGSYWLAGTLSLLAFGVAHLPLWGWGPALTTLVSGAIATSFYIWRRDIVALIVSHVVTDLCGIVVAPYLATRATG